MARDDPDQCPRPLARPSWMQHRRFLLAPGWDHRYVGLLSLGATLAGSPPTRAPTADAPLLSWRQGVHRAWCPTYGRLLFGMFIAFVLLGIIGAVAPKSGRYFDWRLSRSC